MELLSRMKRCQETSISRVLRTEMLMLVGRFWEKASDRWLSKFVLMQTSLSMLRSLA